MSVHMKEQTQSARAGAGGLQERLQELEQKLQEMHREVNEQTLRSLELDREKLSLESELRAEGKRRIRAEEQCAKLEEQLLKDRQRASTASKRGKADSSKDGAAHESGHPEGNAKVGPGTGLEVRHRDKAIKQLTSKVQEMDSVVAYMSSKVPPPPASRGPNPQRPGLSWPAASFDSRRLRRRTCSSRSRSGR